MIPAEVLKKIKQLEIKTKQLVAATMSGEYHSVFKGQGVSFSEVREYKYGDDVRMIDWKVTARTRKPHIKLFEEERELTVILVVDLSHSGEFSSLDQTKLQIAAELSAVLGFSAASNQDQVGLVLFTEDVERYIPPKKGREHILRILRDIFYFKPKQSGTNISKALEFVNRIMKKKAIVFLISDFLDHNYEPTLRVAARKHDLVPIVVQDPKEMVLPKMGRVWLEDTETKRRVLVNTSDPTFRSQYEQVMFSRNMELERLFKLVKLQPIVLDISKPIHEPLVQYFKLRSSRY